MPTQSVLDQQDNQVSNQSSQRSIQSHKLKVNSQSEAYYFMYIDNDPASPLIWSKKKKKKKLQIWRSYLIEEKEYMKYEINEQRSV